MSRKKSYFTHFLGVPQRIREIRGSLTQTVFGRIIGKTQGSVQKYEKGTILPDEDVLKKIADHGGVTVEYLLHGEAAPGPALATEAAAEEYVPRPPYLDKDALERIILLTRDYLRRHRDNISAAGEADLLARLYDYWLDNFEYPDDRVIKHHRRLVK